MDPLLKNWAAQAGSWKSALDFRIREEHLARYTFLDRAEDFYVALIGELFDLLRRPESASPEDLLSVGRVLAFFAFDPTASKLPNVDRARNAIYAACLYYLADYSASARFLVGRFGGSDIANSTDAFLW